MVLKKWEPFRELWERFFEEDFLPTKIASTDVYETDKDVVVEMQIPGFKKEDIKISFQDGYLKVEGKAEEAKEEKEKSYWRKEIRRGSFLRVIPILREVEVKKAKAKLKDGILQVVLPKVEGEKEDLGEKIEIE